MIYAQYLLENGDDLQAVWVGRRDDEGDSNRATASLAAKYHFFYNDYEVDFLISRHFDQRIIGLGGVANVGSSVWRSDIVWTETDSSWQTSAVLNTSYSWIAFGKNMSGQVELFRNGFGIDNGDYSRASLIRNTDLTARISRGELFTLGKHYLNASVTSELTPLWHFTTTLFANLDDYSTLIQLLSQHDLHQSWQLFIAANIPDGNQGSEFALIDESLFVQLGFYF